MKVFKLLKPNFAESETVRNPGEPQEPRKAEASMQTDTSTRKTLGRLSREDQRRLGDILQRVYDDVVRQGVPDRFKNLLDELEDQPAAGKTEPQGSESPEERSAESDRGIAAKGHTSSRNKGSH